MNPILLGILMVIPVVLVIGWMSVFYMIVAIATMVLVVGTICWICEKIISLIFSKKQRNF